MIVGILGTVVFETSPFYVKTLTDISRSVKSRIARHEIIGNKPKIEFQGINLIEISFNIRLDRNLGVNIKKEIQALETLQNGYALGLTIGDRYHGKFMITDIGEDIKYTYRDGQIMVAELSISLLEYVDD